MKLYNSLTKTKEKFEPLSLDKVGVYTCGPTVYHYVTIGNWRTYILADMLVRVLDYLGYEIDYVMNITDVGHLTGDNLGDADTGEDRMEKASKREGKTAWEIAEFYADDFLTGYAQLNLTQPKVFSKATDHIQEQIDLVQQIIDAGFSYTIDDGIYFDVQAYEQAGKNYGQLSNIDQVKEGARVEPNNQKKDPRDFALWKFSPKDEQRQMEWPFDFVLPSDLQNFTQGKDFLDGIQMYQDDQSISHLKGVGFPGWHIECSAMSMKYLGAEFDIHVGGEDLKSTHHPNEIAQAEAVTNKQFVKYWVHGAFLQVDGGRMGKSLGNAYTLHDIEKEGYDPLALKYFYLTGHYHKPLNFTWESLDAAAERYHKLIHHFGVEFGEDETVDESALANSTHEVIEAFMSKLQEDLNLPAARAVIEDGLKYAESSNDIKYLVRTMDQVFGLNIAGEGKDVYRQSQEKQAELKDLLDERNRYRQEKQFDKADQIRDQIEAEGYEIEDLPDGGSKLVAK